MVECDSHETSHMYPNLIGNPSSNQQQFGLKNVNEIKDYFVADIKERELMSKRLSKYIASFYFFVLSVTTSHISIASFDTVIGAPVGMVSASFSLAFSISAGIIKKLLETTRNRKKKNKIVMQTRSKLNRVERKTSEPSINNEISHEEFMTIINEAKNIEN